GAGFTPGQHRRTQGPGRKDRLSGLSANRKEIRFNMNSNLKSAMLAAAQLTAAGNLNAATQAIQRALSGEPPIAGAPAPGNPFAARAAERGRTIDVDARWVEDLQARLSQVARGVQADVVGRDAGATPSAAGSALGSVDTGRFTAAAGSRDYLLYLPPQVASGGQLSLVVMLHGCTQTPADFAAGTAMNEQADRHG